MGLTRREGPHSGPLAYQNEMFSAANTARPGWL
ncbi:hypothetical protein SAMN05216185_103502 [Pseudomonas guariconensis]|nr:hypothetical protein SAMN05216185_103502 [Pseudomonas guariconensis]